MNSLLIRLVTVVAAAVLLTSAAIPVAVLADADEAVSPNSTSLGLQPIAGPIPLATAAPGESPSFQRPDGAYQAIPLKQGRVRVFHLVERSAPWTLQPGLTVMANTYNGVVPGPALVVKQGDTLVIDYTNDGATPDSIHMHGVHDIPVAMDGVGGISQPLVPHGGHFVYHFVADQPGTFIYHSHDNEAMLDSGLYGAIIVEPSQPRPVERGLAHDFLEVISSWQIQSGARTTSRSTVKSIPPRAPRRPLRRAFSIRWINISAKSSTPCTRTGTTSESSPRRQAGRLRDVEDTVLDRRRATRQRRGRRQRGAGDVARPLSRHAITSKTSKDLRPD